MSYQMGLSKTGLNGLGQDKSDKQAYHYGEDWTLAESYQRALFSRNKGKSNY